MVVSEERIAALEARTKRLEARMALLDGRDCHAPDAAGSIAPPKVRSAQATPPCADRAATLSAPRRQAPLSTRPAAPSRARSAVPPAARRHALPPSARRVASLPGAGLEDLVGGRVLAWVGGLAVLVGLLFFLVVAASRGWIGDVARVLMAGGASVLLLAAGAWLHERRGRSEAALAAAAAGIAGMFATAVVAGPVYDLVPAPAALVLALGSGTVATLLALRFEAPGIGWLGILGALLAPALVGAAGDGVGVALMLVAYAASGAVLLWQRWHALAGAAFLVAAPQLAWWLLDSPGGGPPAAAVVAALTAFGAVSAASAVGFEWRTRTRRLRVSAHVLLALNALALAGLGAIAFHESGSELWLAALALAHIGAGLLLRRSRRVGRELSLTVAGLGIVLADVAFAAVADGLPLVLGWAGGAVAFSALARAARDRSEEAVALAGLGGHLLLAIATALTAAAPLTAVAGGGDDAGTALTGVAAIAAAAWAAARLIAPRLEVARVALDGLALGALALFSAIALDGLALTLALAGEAAALAAIAQRRRRTAPAGEAPPAAPARNSDQTAAAGEAAAPNAPAMNPDQTAAAGEAAAPNAPAMNPDQTAPAGEAPPVAPDRRGDEIAADAEDAAAGEPRVRAGRAPADDPVPFAAALAFLGAALAHALVVLAPPVALVAGLDRPLHAALGLGAVAAAAILAGVAGNRAQLRLALHAGATVVVLYLASTLLVTPFQPGAEAAGMEIAELGVRQQGQALLSALWALAGVVALVAGLLRDSRALRLGALALVTVTVAKVFAYDLASLTSLYRVGSCVALGVLLLLGAFAWQRIRPRALPDLRGVPTALR
jgi:uncharacterized membrane protein